MRIGIFSDTHANWEALTACLDALRELSADEYVCLGDTVGYGASPNECADEVRETVLFTVLGNHDAAVAGRMDYSYYRDDARSALDAHARILTPENMAWLRSLDYRREHRGLGFCHGSPIDPSAFEYVFVQEHAEDLVPLIELLPPITFVGHSHLCKAFEMDADGAREISPIDLQRAPDKKYIVSVGSVGQPRDYDPRAACGIYDVDEGRFQLLRVRYDIETASRKIIDAGLSATFAKRLFIGV